MNSPLSALGLALQDKAMAVTVTSQRSRAQAPTGWKAHVPGLALVAVGVVAAASIGVAGGGVPLIVAAVLAGVAFGNAGLVTGRTRPGLAFASKTLLRAGIVLLGLRLSINDVADLGVATLAAIVVTVAGTFFAVQAVGRRLGLSEGLSLLVASGFSICGNSAIASVKGVVEVDDEEVAAAIGLVTLCGTLAIVVVPALGSLLGLPDTQLGIWTGASVQDTAQVIAVASTAGPAVLAVATAVKLTRVLFLAPIVVGLSAYGARRGEFAPARAQAGVLPVFVLGFTAAMLLRTGGVMPDVSLDFGRHVEQHLLAAGMVGLGSSVRLPTLRRLGVRPLLLGAAAWLTVGSISLAAISVLRLG